MDIKKDKGWEWYTKDDWLYFRPAYKETVKNKRYTSIPYGAIPFQLIKHLVENTDYSQRDQKGWIRFEDG